MPAATPEITIIGKPECHLCDDARAVIAEVVAELGGTIAVTERSILEDAELHERYWEQIPVVLIDGELHARWHVDRDRLRAALGAA